MAKKVFVFDMDGVLIPSEKEWLKLEEKEGLFNKVFGEEVTAKMGDLIGMSTKNIYRLATSFGAKISKKEYDQFLDQKAVGVYQRSTLSAGADKVAQFLKKQGWQLALLSSSPQSWINMVLKRLKWRKLLDLVVSVNDHSELKAKPAPDGYNYILKTLGAKALDSIALEDSNPGIISAKAAGLFTIGYREHLVDGYKQIKADVIAKNMVEVLAILH